MSTYPSKILLAWSEAIGGNEKIAKWLFDNGYPELICVIDFLWGSTKAGEWMLVNRYPEWRAFSEYIGGENVNARKWLIQNKFDILAYTGDAVHNIDGSFERLKKDGFLEFIVIAKKLNRLLYQIEFDTNLIYRSPIS